MIRDISSFSAKYDIVVKFIEVTMETILKYKHYPFRTVFLANLVSLGIYGSGFVVMLKAGIYFAFGYLLYILYFEYRLVRFHCSGCYYMGKRCGFGRGFISSCLFKKGDPAIFSMRKATWKNLIPDMLITIIPLVTGIILLILVFDFLLIITMLFLIFLTTSGNGYIRSSLTCKHCIQREMGCPADQLFHPEKQDQS
jgi:hypothetical protein